MDTLADAATPESIAAAAQRLGCTSVAFTYNDPTIFMEYAADVADACRDVGVKTVAVTAGYINPEAREDLYAHLDAANVDLKGFTEEFYKHVCVGHLAPVLESLEYLRHETDVWFEITTLLIPDRNDSDAELDQLTSWVAEHLGPDVPLHFTAFHPDFKMLDVPPTPPATLRRAREWGVRNGLHYVYVGNVHDDEGSSTYCTGCSALLIERDWYELGKWHLTDDGRCKDCGTQVPGRFDGPPGRWGRRRVPVQLRARGA
jgi:pyruvate formate lyase activating enzyme